MQHDGWGKMYKYRNSLLKLFNEKSKFVIGANFGPYKNIEFLEKNKFLLGQCTDVCVRDSYSYNLLSSLNNIRIAPDIVFQLKPKNINKIKNSIGISILNLENRDDLKEYQQIYNKKIKEMVEELINRGQKITFFSFCESQGDMKAINEVIKIVDNKFLKNINIVNYTGDIDDFLIKFESMENIIGTRFHACILSQVFGQGLYPIIYSDKTYNVLKDIDLDKEYIYIKDLEKLNTTHVLDVISSNKIKNEKIFKESEKQFEALDKFIMGRLN